MDLKLAALRALLRDPSSNYTAVAVAVAVLVTFGLVIVLTLIATILPGRRPVRQHEASSLPEGDDQGGAGANEDDDSLTPISPAARRSRGCAGVALVAVTIALGAIGAGALWYRGTSVNSYCSQTCHSMSKAVLSWQHSPHSAIPCVRCHESADLRAIPRNAAKRLYFVYLQATDSTAGPDPVPQTRCIACHAGVLDAKLIARNGETFTHRQALVATPACDSCHGQQGHQPARR